MDTAGTAGTAAVEGTRATAVTAVRTSRGKTQRMKSAGPTPTRVHGATTGEAIVLNIKVVTWSLAVFSSVTYLICVLYGLIVPESLHMSDFLEQVLPGFTWLTGWGFLIGLVEAFLYGAYAGLVFTPVYNVFQRKWGEA